MEEEGISKIAACFLGLIHENQAEVTISDMYLG